MHGLCWVLWKKAVEMWINPRILEIPWGAQITNGAFLRKMKCHTRKRFWESKILIFCPYNEEKNKMHTSWKFRARELLQEKWSRGLKTHANGLGQDQLNCIVVQRTRLVLLFWWPKFGTNKAPEEYKILYPQHLQFKGRKWWQSYGRARVGKRQVNTES